MLYLAKKYGNDIAVMAHWPLFTLEALSGKCDVIGCEKNFCWIVTDYQSSEERAKWTVGCGRGDALGCRRGNLVGPQEDFWGLNLH